MTSSVNLNKSLYLIEMLCLNSIDVCTVDGSTTSIGCPSGKKSCYWNSPTFCFTVFYEIHQ